MRPARFVRQTRWRKHKLGLDLTGKGLVSGMRRFLEGLHNAVRRAQIARAPGGRLASESVAALELGAACPCCADGLHALVAWRRLRDLARPGASGGVVRALKPTAMAVDLAAYPTFADWERAVSRETDGKYRRAANRARRAGFAARQIGVGSFVASLHAIRASKLLRSKGVVWQAREGAASGHGDVELPCTPPACDRHWRLDWGVMQPTPAGDRMVAYASLLRAGNSAQALHFIGHGAHLADGVVKLLHFEIMDWLLARRDSCVQGLDYLFYGTLEEGNDGLLDFKRYTKFAPVLIDCADAPDDAPPPQFDGALYLELNPDVAKAGVNPYRHYLMDGMLEGRPTRRATQDEDA